MATLTYRLGYDFIVPQPSIKTINTQVGEYASDNNWVNGTSYTSMDLGDVTLTMTKTTSNGGVYSSSDESWNMGYSNLIPGSDQLTIATKDTSKKILNIILYYTGTGELGSGAYILSSGYKLNVNSNSVVLYVRAGAGGYDTYVHITQIVIQYEPSLGPTTYDFTIQEVATDNNWVNSNSYYSLDIPTSGTARVNIAINNNGNSANGMYYSGTMGRWDIRDTFGSYTKGTLTISAVDPTKKILSVIPIFTTGSRGKCTYNGNDITTGTELTPDSNSITLSVRSTSSNEGRVSFNELTITVE